MKLLRVHFEVELCGFDRLCVCMDRGEGNANGGLKLNSGSPETD